MPNDYQNLNRKAWMWGGALTMNVFGHKKAIGCDFFGDDCRLYHRDCNVQSGQNQGKDRPGSSQESEQMAGTERGPDPCPGAITVSRNGETFTVIMRMTAPFACRQNPKPSTEQGSLLQTRLLILGG